MRKLNEGGILLRGGLEHEIMSKGFDYSDFVTTVKLRTAQAILPDLEWKFAPLHLPEAQPSKEIGDVSESKDCV